MSPNKKRVMELLLDGKVPAARRFYHEAVAFSLQTKREALQAEEEEAALLNAMISAEERKEESEAAARKAVERAVASSAGAVGASPRRKLQKAEQSKIIVDIARSLAAAEGGKVSAQKVVEELGRRGFELESSVPRTAVGNILFKASGWQRVDKGVFRHAGQSH